MTQVLVRSREITDMQSKEFMKSNCSKLLLTILGLIELVSLLIAMPAQAQRGGTNPRPSIFNEPPYNRGQPQTETPSTPPQASTSSQTSNLVRLLETDGSFTTLVTALKAAELVETLTGEGRFTIFAPTDEAFASLPEDALRELLKPENKEVLVKLLTYHVVTGELLSSGLQSGQVTLQGDPIDVQVDSNGVHVNNATVVRADIRASNGVIHAIDTVLLPPSL